EVESVRVLRGPSKAGIGRGPGNGVLRYGRQSPVVDDLAVLVAAGRVIRLTDGELVRVARDHAVDQPDCVAATNEVLEQRRDIDERRRVADRVVLVLVMRFVRADGVVAGPFAIVQALGERERALVHGGPDGP